MNKNLNNQGQVLLIVVVSLAVLLGVGLSISSNTISSTLRTSRTDSFQKVTAAAEGGIEKSLAQTDNVLGAKITAGNPETLEFPASNTKSTITVADYTAGSSGVIFETLQPGEVGTFYFVDTSNGFDPATFSNDQSACVKISTTTSNPSYMLNVFVRNAVPGTFTNIAPAAVPATGSLDSTLSNNFLQNKYIYSSGRYSPSITSCSTGGILLTGPLLLRIHPISQTLNNLKIEVIGTTPGDVAAKNVRQGFKITSKGEFLTGGDGSTRVIEAVKYLDAPSNIFDYAAFIDYE